MCCRYQRMPKQYIRLRFEFTSYIHVFVKQRKPRYNCLRKRSWRNHFLSKHARKTSPLSTSANLNTVAAQFPPFQLHTNKRTRFLHTLSTAYNRKTTTTTLIKSVAPTLWWNRRYCFLHVKTTDTVLAIAKFTGTPHEKIYGTSTVQSKLRKPTDHCHDSQPCLFSQERRFALLHCCDRKSRAACAQCFAPRQQATTEIMRRNLSYYCLLALHIQWCYSSRTSRSWWITQPTVAPSNSCWGQESSCQRQSNGDQHLLSGKLFAENLTAWNNAFLECMTVFCHARGAHRVLVLVPRDLEMKLLGSQRLSIFKRFATVPRIGFAARNGSIDDFQYISLNETCQIADALGEKTPKREKTIFAQSAKGIACGVARKSESRKGRQVLRAANTKCIYIKKTVSSRSGNKK